MAWEPFEKIETYPLDVQKHFARNDIRVPSVEAIAKELGVVLLEDLGDLTLERKFWENHNQEMALPFYQQTIDELIKIHLKPVVTLNRRAFVKPPNSIRRSSCGK